jgi:hypothetical protein
MSRARSGGVGASSSAAGHSDPKNSEKRTLVIENKKKKTYPHPQWGGVSPMALPLPPLCCRCAWHSRPRVVGLRLWCVVVPVLPRPSSSSSSPIAVVIPHVSSGSPWREWVLGWRRHSLVLVVVVRAPRHCRPPSSPSPLLLSGPGPGPVVVVPSRCGPPPPPSPLVRH